MRVGLDQDWLLVERPEFFAFLTAALRSAGHFVAVLTYRDPASRAKTDAQLRGWGIAYDDVHFARSLSDILDHGRDSSSHVRGCWVIDGVLGKE